MRIVRIDIENFRGIAKGELFFSGHTVLVGDNNAGKSTVLEAIDLVLGPERLGRQPVIDEHDFHVGCYVDSEGNPVEIKIEVVVVDLTDEQIRYFKDHLEWWNENGKNLLEGPPPEDTDPGGRSPLPCGWVSPVVTTRTRMISPAQHTFYRPVKDDGTYTYISELPINGSADSCFLRTLRTGSRALSLERGSLLDTILHLKEIRLQMWEQVLAELRKLPVADKPELGLSQILSKVQDAVRSFVPSDWADNPHMRVSDLTQGGLQGELLLCSWVRAQNVRMVPSTRHLFNTKELARSIRWFLPFCL